MFQDFINIARKHTTAFVAAHIALVVGSFLLIETLGYLIWRRFPLPVFILTCSLITLAIAKLFPTSRWFSSLFRSSGAMGVGAAVLMLVGGFIDAALWPTSGYAVSLTIIAFGYLVTFNIVRLYLHLKELSPDGRERVAMSGDEIAIEMRLAAAAAREYAEEIEQITPTLKTVGIR